MRLRHPMNNGPSDVPRVGAVLFGRLGAALGLLRNVADVHCYSGDIRSNNLRIAP